MPGLAARRSWSFPVSRQFTMDCECSGYCSANEPCSGTTRRVDTPVGHSVAVSQRNTVHP